MDILRKPKTTKVTIQTHLIIVTVKVTIVIIVFGINPQSTIKVCMLIAKTIWIRVIVTLPLIQTPNQTIVQILGNT